MMLCQADQDRQINEVPPPFLANVSPYNRPDFAATVKSACLSSQLIAAGLKISKAIIIGNVSVGKSAIVNR